MGSILGPRQIAFARRHGAVTLGAQACIRLDLRAGGDHVLTNEAALALAIVIWSALVLTVVAYAWLRRKEAQDLNLQDRP